MAINTLLLRSKELPVTSLSHLNQSSVAILVINGDSASERLDTCKAALDGGPRRDHNDRRFNVLDLRRKSGFTTQTIIDA